ncbi:MAG: potassium channel family protein [Desulfarculaceae bacterium]|nr:potassium channel family protein [Desulfarculaceae bacterium]MCF8047842.1 potassium channel family protein [Desulfarculaceae bacterium]MCF8063927.1 potassium channel family protein [Desulfarculaceae bacterium]MCF8100008.1 potassium channel family protein [Desulfarculaceae bacterium]MCF8122909.1 potassium channel family protein [Desulfarculaceae bacterium]
MKKVQTGPVAAPRYSHKLPWFKSRHLWLFIILMLYFLMVPLIEQILPRTRTILDLFIILVLVAAAYTVINRKRTFVLALVLLVAGLILVLGDYHWHSNKIMVVACVCYVGFLGIIIYSILKEVMTLREVSFDTISGALNGYLLMGLMWGFAYQAVEAAWPGSFAIAMDANKLAGVSAYVGPELSSLFYFSFVTITTTGYGDITPLSTIAGQLAITESVVGQFYMVVLVARLVSLHTMLAPKGKRQLTK